MLTVGWSLILYGPYSTWRAGHLDQLFYWCGLIHDLLLFLRSHSLKLLSHPVADVL